MPKTKTKSADKPRVALYCRVSTTTQNTDMQLTELRDVARQRGWHVVQEFIDEGISGARTDRPGLDAMLADARAAKFDTLMVWKLDRLGRSLSHLLTLLDEFNRLNIGFVSIRDAGFDTVDSPTRRLLLGLIAIFSDYERSIIVDRVRAGVARAKMAGKHCGRPKAAVDIRPIRALQERGHSIREIAGMLGVSRGTVWRRLKDAADVDANNDGGGDGRGAGGADADDNCITDDDADTHMEVGYAAVS